MNAIRTLGLALLLAGPLAAQAPVKKDSTPPAPAAPARDTSTTLVREVFSYEGAGRDPFASLLRNGDVRPLMADLKLLAIYFDGQYPGRSVAVLRDITTQKRYEVKPEKFSAV